MATPSEEYVVASSFKVSIEGLQSQSFDTVAGMGVTFEDITQQAEKGNGMENRPGRFNANDITLTRRFKKDKELYNWVKDLKSGKPTRKSGSIIILDDEDKEVFRYNFTGSWIKAWHAPSLSKERHGNNLLTETVVLSVQNIEMA